MNYITPLDKLETEAADIDYFLSTPCSEDGNLAVKRGETVQVYIGRTAKMMADAKYHLDLAITVNTVDVYDKFPGMSPSSQNRLIKSKCLKETYVFTWINRLNAACTHHSEWLRTIISKAKAEYQQTKSY